MSYPRAHSSTTILFPERTVLLPISWILRAAVGAVVIVALLVFAGAMYGWRDGYAQGYRAGIDSK